MKSTRLRVIPAVVAASALLLSGCGGSDEKDAPSGPLSQVEVTGGSKDAAPEVSLEPKPLTVSETTTRVLKEGDGEKTTANDIVMTDYLVISGADGSTLEDAYPQKPLGFDLSSKKLLPGLKKALLDRKLGSRLLVAIPPEDAFGPQGNAQLKVGPEDTLLFVVNLRSTVEPLDHAKGTEVKPEKGMPKVTWHADKAASFEMPEGDPPKDTKRAYLIKGKGEKVKKGDNVRVSYTGALWRNGEVFDSSLTRGQPFDFTVGQGQVIKAWDTELVGVPVGSRIILVVPPKDGYGSSGSRDGKIKGDDTIVFVVDVLAAY